MALDHIPLADVVASVVADFQRHGPNPKFSLAVGRLARSYGNTIDITIHRCLQEGITNVVRHANARTIAIELNERPIEVRPDGKPEAGTMLQLSIQDDGRGIAPGTSRGLGLTGMEERVHALGGSIAITSRPGAGTCLRISIPLEQDRIAVSGAEHTRSGRS